MNVNVNAATSLSQKKKILAYMREGKGINQLTASRKFGCYRLGARIAEIKKELEGTDEQVVSEYMRDPKSHKMWKMYRIIKIG